jgi:hypothetical protein
MFVKDRAAVLHDPCHRGDVGFWHRFEAGAHRRTKSVQRERLATRTSAFVHRFDSSRELQTRIDAPHALMR